MQRISFAPVLSATLSRDSCWIISFSLSSWFSLSHEQRAWPNTLCAVGLRPGGLGSSGLGRRGLLGLLEDLHDAPTLRCGQRTRLHEQDPVADAALVLLVVRLQLAGAAHDLAVQRVLDAVLDGHDHGLVHLVADDQALTDLASVALDLVVGGLLAHAAPPSELGSLSEPGVVRMPSSRSRTTV